MRLEDLKPAYGPLSWREQDAACFFSSDESLRWFIRRHRQELLRRKAIAVIGARVFVVPVAMSKAVAELAVRNAATNRRFARSA